MKIIVTGHRGYVGRVLVPLLVEAGYEVVGIDVNLYTEFDLEKPTWKIQEIEKDIRDITPKDLKVADVVIHLAAISNDPMGEQYKSLTRDVNYWGTVHLAQCAKYAGVKRFLFSSSCSVYGRSDEVKEEHSSIYPLTEYARSKIEAEGELMKMATLSFDVIILRNATLFGYSPALRTDLVVNTLVWEALDQCYATLNEHNDAKVIVKSDGTPWRPFLHVKDLGLIILEILKHIPTSVVLNIGGMNLQISMVATKIAMSLECPIEYLNQDPDARSYRVSFEKMEHYLKYLPFPLSIETGVKEIKTAYNGNHINRYKRLQQLAMIEPNFSSFFQLRSV